MSVDLILWRPRRAVKKTNSFREERNWFRILIVVPRTVRNRKRKEEGKQEGINVLQFQISACNNFAILHEGPDVAISNLQKSARGGKYCEILVDKFAGCPFSWPENGKCLLRMRESSHHRRTSVARYSHSEVGN